MITTTDAESELQLLLYRCCDLFAQYRDTLARYDCDLGAELQRECFTLVEGLVDAGLYEWDSDDVSALGQFHGIDMVLAVECVKLGNDCEPDDRLYAIAKQAREQAEVAPTIIVKTK